MSHFTVLVVGENPEEQLAPYQENNMGDCPQKYLEFHDVEDEYYEKWLKGSTVQTIKRKRKGVETEIRKSVPFIELYATFPIFMKEYCGYESRDEKTGRYGYWENPNRKWDWYQLGGRWRGVFKLKKGATGLTGEAGVFKNKPMRGERTADQCRIKDIDFQGIYDEVRRDSNKRFDKFEEVLKGRPLPKSFKEVRDAMFPDDIEEARKFYNDQEVIKDLRKSGFDLIFDDVVEVFGVGRDKYVERRVRSSIVTFAVVMDGKWFEKGEMGWWGVVSNEQDEDEWVNQFYEMIQSLPQDTLVSVYDCHI